MTYCAVGDEESDPTLMEFLGAEMKKESGQFFKVDTTCEEEVEKANVVSGLGDALATPPGA